LELSIFASYSNIFAGTSGGGVYVSGDNGAHWTAMNNGIKNSSVEAFAVAGSALYASTFGAGVFQSSDDGGIGTPITRVSRT